MRETIMTGAADTAALMQLGLFGEEETGAAAPAAMTAHDAGEQTGLQADFETMIRGMYKEAFAQKVQQIIDRRLKDMRSLQKQAKETEPLLAVLRAQLNLQEGTPGDLLQALQQAGLPQSIAPQPQSGQTDVPPDAQERRAAFVQSAGQRYRRLAEQAQQAATYYADFDLARECRDPAFAALVLKGLDMKTAYEVRHRDALLRQAMQRAAAQAVQHTLQDIRMRGLRPMENGLQAGSGVRSRTDVSGMTRAQRAGIARRVMRGERVTLD